MPNPVIRVNNLSFSYLPGVPVLEHADFEVFEKDYLAVIGPNGGGKSTLMKILLGLLDPKEGSVELLGKRPSESRLLAGYVPQHFHFDFDFPMNVLDVVLLGRLGHQPLGRPYTEQDRQVAYAMLKKVGMDHFAKREISQLSGGERQRVLIARALATEPKILILDEPTSSVDVQWQEKLHELLEELNEEMTILLISHHIDIICGHVEKVLFVNKDVHLHETLPEAVEHIGKVYGFPDSFTLKNICT